MTHRRTKGTGSLIEARPGVWRLRVFTHPDPRTGHPRQVNRTVYTKKRGGKSEAQAALTKLLREVQQGKHKGTDATFGTLLTDWLAWLEHQGKRPSTMATYRTHVENRIRPELGSVKLSKLRPDRLDAFYMAQRESGLGVRTVTLLHSIIAAALEQGVKWGWLDKNPARQARPPRDTRDAPSALTPEQVQRLVDAADIDLAAAIMLAALTGARRGELCGLRWSDVDWENRTIRIERARVPVDGQGIVEGKTKTGRGRTIHLDPVAMTALGRYRMEVGGRQLGEAPEDPWLLTPDDGTTPTNPKALSHHLTKLGKRLGIPVHTHSLRHFSATQLVAAGVDVTTASSRLGHTTAVMLETYSHPISERDAEAAAVLGRLLERGTE